MTVIATANDSQHYCHKLHLYCFKFIIHFNLHKTIYMVGYS